MQLTRVVCSIGHSKLHTTHTHTHTTQTQTQIELLVSGSWVSSSGDTSPAGMAWLMDDAMALSLLCHSNGNATYSLQLLNLGFWVVLPFRLL